MSEDSFNYQHRYGLGGSSVVQHLHSKYKLWIFFPGNTKQQKQKDDLCKTEAKAVEFQVQGWPELYTE
jgi:hypothetical protein